MCTQKGLALAVKGGAWSQARHFNFGARDFPVQMAPLWRVKHEPELPIGRKGQGGGCSGKGKSCACILRNSRASEAGRTTRRLTGVQVQGCLVISSNYKYWHRDTWREREGGAWGEAEQGDRYYAHKDHVHQSSKCGLQPGCDQEPLTNWSGAMIDLSFEQSLVVQRGWMGGGKLGPQDHVLVIAVTWGNGGL